MAKVDTTIPFSGFYNSNHDELLDEGLNTLLSDSSGDPYPNLIDKAYLDIEWGAIHREYARAYVKAFAAEFNLKTLEFDELVCPKFYNFETDRIFCKIDLDEVKELYAAVDKARLGKLIKERFTSRSGFISYYANDLESWSTDLSEWDHNQVGTLLAAYVEQEANPFNSDKEIDLFNYPSDLAYNLVSNNLGKANRIANIASYLRTREERKYS